MKKANSLRDKIAFRIIRFGFRIATKNNPKIDNFRYQLNGDSYTFESVIYRLTKTNDDELNEMVGEDNAKA